MDCNVKANRQDCTCTYEPCSRKGKCCECISFHRGSDELPACYFTTDVERSFDRSVARFIASRKN